MKLVLAHCSEKNRHFCLEVKENGTKYSVVNFIELSQAEKSHIPADYVEGNLITAANLVPCKKCGTRVVGSCNCAKNSERCKNGKFNFDCLYCKSLQLDKPKSKDLRILVSSPCFDDIAQVLDSLKLKYGLYNGEFDCDLLFINCGTEDYFDSNELAKFVEDGGCVYISDLASFILSEAFPDIVEFSNNGEACKIKADVVDTELMQIAGTQLDIEFDLGSWSVIEKYRNLEKANGKVLLRAAQGNKYAGKPIMISFQYGKGTVFYTCFHNHAQASEKEKMLLQLLLLKQIGTSSNQTVEQVGSLMGLNITLMKEKFKRK